MSGAPLFVPATYVSGFEPRPMALRTFYFWVSFCPIHGFLLVHEGFKQCPEGVAQPGQCSCLCIKGTQSPACHSEGLHSLEVLRTSLFLGMLKTQEIGEDIPQRFQGLSSKRCRWCVRVLYGVLETVGGEDVSCLSGRKPALARYKTSTCRVENQQLSKTKSAFVRYKTGTYQVQKRQRSGSDSRRVGSLWRGIGSFILCVRRYQTNLMSNKIPSAHERHALKDQGFPLERVQRQVALLNVNQPNFFLPVFHG